jgi:acyl-CoA thioester hydrolase
MRSDSAVPIVVSYSKGCKLRPKPFIPEAHDGDDRYVRDKTTGMVWHRCELRTLYVDTDRSQVVYHSNYLRYFEYGRASLMRDAAYPYREIEESGFIYPIIKVDVDYYRPLYYDEAMYIHTRPSTMERVRLQFDYVITHVETGDIVVIGLTRHCATNASGTPVEVDPKTVRLWEIFPK